MSFTYKEDLSRKQDLVRFYLSDTVDTAPRLSDEEINAILGIYSDPLEAAAVCADRLSAKYSRVSSVQIGSFSKSGGEQAQLYADLATRLRAQKTERPGGLGMPYVGGVSIGEMNRVEANTDRPRSQFDIGMDDNPSALGPQPDPNRRDQ